MSPSISESNSNSRRPEPPTFSGGPHGPRGPSESYFEHRAPGPQGSYGSSTRGGFDGFGESDESDDFFGEISRLGGKRGRVSGHEAISRW